MTTVDQVLARARLALDRGTPYWLGAGGTDPRTPLPSTPVHVAAAWAASTPDKRAELAPLAAAMGIDVHNPNLILDACDCSGFVCWALGFSRTAPSAQPYTTADGSIYTDSIYHDACGPAVRFKRMRTARPGSLVVYPSHPPLEKYGHIAIVIEADDQGNATRIIHCSKDNVTGSPHDAIKVTAPTAFAANEQSVYAWCRDVD